MKKDNITERWNINFESEEKLIVTPKWEELNEYIYEKTNELIGKIKAVEEERILRHLPDFVLDELQRMIKTEKKYRKENKFTL